MTGALSTARIHIVLEDLGRRIARRVHAPGSARAAPGPTGVSGARDQALAIPRALEPGIERPGTSGPQRDQDGSASSQSPPVSPLAHDRSDLVTLRSRSELRRAGVLRRHTIFVSGVITFRHGRCALPEHRMDALRLHRRRGNEVGCADHHHDPSRPRDLWSSRKDPPPHRSHIDIMCSTHQCVTRENHDRARRRPGGKASGDRP